MKLRVLWKDSVLKNMTSGLFLVAFLIALTLVVTPTQAANQSTGVDFTITQDKQKGTPSVIPINPAVVIPTKWQTTASFTIDLGKPNNHGTEDSAQNVKQQDYTISSGNNGVIDSVVVNGTNYPVPANSNTFSFTIAGNPSNSATFGATVVVHYTSSSAADDDKVISMSGIVTFNDDAPATPDKLANKAPNPTVTATAVEIDSLSSDATQTNVSQGVTINGTMYDKNWAAVKAVGNVTITAKLKPDTDNAAAAITWAGGNSVVGKPRQRTVTKTEAAVTPVKVTCGSESDGLYLWIIWSTYEIRLSGATDTGQKCKAQNADTILGPPNGAGKWRADVGGTTTCGPDDHDSNPAVVYKYAVGRTQGICTLKPGGIGQIIKAGSWNMARHVKVIAWDNGGNYNGGAWAAGASIDQADRNDQGPDFAVDLDPSDTDGPDKLYDADPPACSVLLAGLTINHTSELYANFTAWATITLDGTTDICDHVSYSYKAQVDIDAAAQHVVANTLSTTAIAPWPAAPKWAKR